MNTDRNRRKILKMLPALAVAAPSRAFGRTQAVDDRRLATVLLEVFAEPDTARLMGAAPTRLDHPVELRGLQLSARELVVCMVDVTLLGGEVRVDGADLWGASKARAHPVPAVWGIEKRIGVDRLRFSAIAPNWICPESGARGFADFGQSVADGHTQTAGQIG